MTRVAGPTPPRLYGQADRHAGPVGPYRAVLASHCCVHGPGSRDEGYTRVTMGEVLEEGNSLREARDDAEPDLREAYYRRFGYPMSDNVVWSRVKGAVRHAFDRVRDAGR